MVKRERTPVIQRKRFKKKGSGIINSLINKLPIELHLPNYNYCGPGTKLKKRLSRGDSGINKLDEACKEHDISYLKYTDLNKRHQADQVLAKKAFDRFKSSDSSLGEKLSSLVVSGIMKAKTKLGAGFKKKRFKNGGQITFNNAVRRARKQLTGKKITNLKNAAISTLSSIKNLKLKAPTRIIPIPKTGGILPLIPIFAGLSALGALSGGAAGIASAVNAAKHAQKKLEEQKRHNKTMEKISIGKGLFLRPYKKGCGLYLKPYSKNC